MRILLAGVFRAPLEPSGAVGEHVENQPEKEEAPEPARVLERER